MAADDDDVRKAFQELDQDKSGVLSKAEIAAALEKLRLPGSLASDVLSRMDRNKDGVLDFDEFSTYIKQKDQDLRSVFDAIDRDGTGFLNEGEIGQALSRLGYHASEAATRHVLASMDRNKDGRVSYSEFRTVFALVRPADVFRIFDVECQLFEMATPQSLVDLHATVGKVSGAQAAHNNAVDLGKRLLTGGFAAVIAQFCLQPIETVKVRLQNEGLQKGPSKYRGSFFRGFSVIYREEGLARGLYKGMLPSAIREMSYSTLRFGLYVPLKRLLGATDPRDTPFWKKLASGGGAGGIGAAIANPTDLVKARMQACDFCWKLLIRGRYTGPSPAPSAGHHCRTIYKERGLKGFYLGTGATISRAVVLGATKLGCYDEFKVRFQDRLGLTGIPLQASSAAATGFLVACTTAPIDLVRTRLMTRGGYKGSSDVFLKTVRHEGVFALYRGFFPQFARFAPYTVIQFMAWEQLSKLAGISVTK